VYIGIVREKGNYIMNVEQQIVETIATTDPFDYIYDCISGNHGQLLQEYVTELYNDVVIDTRLHPDDDFEQIIERILDNLEA
jgi:guanyl-specific ribonuclease Sa